MRPPPDEGPRVLGLHLASLLGATFGLVFVPINLVRGAPVVAALDAVMATLLIGNLLWFRRSRHVTVSTYFAMTIVVGALLPMTLSLGAQIYLWFAVLPVVAFFLLGSKHGAIFVTATLVLLAGWLAAFPPTWKPEQFPLAMVSSFVFAGAMSFAVEHVKSGYARKLRELSTVDPLTSCLNRRSGAELLEGERARLERYGRPLALALLDIDCFKKINDEWGHQAGDRVLQEVSRRLRETTRQNDAVVRWGGEEFLVVLPETDAAGGHRAAERLRHRIAATPIDPVGTVTLSGGVAEVRAGGEADLRSTMHRADALLYEAKRSGRNRVLGDVDDDGTPELGSPRPFPSAATA